MCLRDPKSLPPCVCRGSLPIAFPLSCSKKADGAPQAAALRKFRLHTKNVQNPWKMFEEFSIVSPWCAWAAGQFFFTTRNKARRGLLGESKAHAPGTALASRGRTQRSRRSLHTHPDPGHGDLSPVSGRLTETRVRTVRATPGRGGQRESPRGARRRGGDAGAEPRQPASVPSRPSTRGSPGPRARHAVLGELCGRHRLLIRVLRQSFHGGGSRPAGSLSECPHLSPRTFCSAPQVPFLPSFAACLPHHPCQPVRRVPTGHR